MKDGYKVYVKQVFVGDYGVNIWVYQGPGQSRIDAEAEAVKAAVGPLLAQFGMVIN